VSDFVPLKAYDDGMQGWINSARERVLWQESQPRPIYSEPNSMGSGDGKRALLWQYVRKLDPLSFTEVQTVGDCFVAGTLVRMGDGTEKPIEAISTGDEVASPFGGIRRVLSVFSKPYQGTVCSLTAEGCMDSVTATEDHRFVSFVNKQEFIWESAGGLSVSDRMFVPRTEITREAPHVFDLSGEHGCASDPNELPDAPTHNSRRLKADDGMVRVTNGKYQCRRHVELDAEVAWLIGLWLAEGSTDKNKNGEPISLTLNLASDEMLIASKAKSIVQSRFGTPAKIVTIPSKPSCLFVNIASTPLARLVYRICGNGNVYNKRVPKEILTSCRSVRMACLRGWMEGDGCVMNKPRSGRPQYKMCKASGVSVCRPLVRDMKYLAVSCGVRCTDTARKARGRSRAASELHFYGEGAVAVMPSRLKTPAATRGSTVWRVAGGFAPRVKSNVRSQFAGTVYCIEVEEDHAFVANGYAVHNCVSHSSRNARDCTRAVQVLLENRPESFVKRGATEPTYGARGHSGEGMVPARAATFERDVGFCIRQKYEPVDLSKYNGNIGTNWGSSGVPNAVADICRQHKVGIIRQITTVRDAMDALASGYGLHSGQYAKWAGSPNSQNIHPRQAGGWSHAMATVGMDDTKEFWPFTVFFIANSWGGWNQPVKDWPSSYPEQVPGMIVTKADDWAVCVTDGDCWAYGNVDGFPPQKLPDYGAIGLLQT
jgi:hypothetical protein